MGDVEQVIAQGEALLDLIPQSPPMVMIDGLIVSEENLFKTRFQIEADNVFVANNRFSEAGLLENIAQTAAAGFSYQNRAGNKPIPIGFIGAIQNLRIHELPPAGVHISTVVTVKHAVMNIVVINGTVSCKESVIAQCDMKIVLKN